MSGAFLGALIGFIGSLSYIDGPGANIVIGATGVCSALGFASGLLWGKQALKWLLSAIMEV